MSQQPLAVIRACRRAYVERDRAAIESLLDANYHFTSPIDNALDGDRGARDGTRFEAHGAG